jgi:hypothetical protein
MERLSTLTPSHPSHCSNKRSSGFDLALRLVAVDDGSAGLVPLTDAVKGIPARLAGCSSSNVP